MKCPVLAMLAATEKKDGGILTTVGLAGLPAR